MNFKFLPIIDNLEFIPQLITRISLGSIFLTTGYGKITHLSATTEYFSSLGIPLAHIQAPIVALTEIVCGAALIIGLATRLSSFLLAGIMIVAILTAKIGDLSGLRDLFQTMEFCYAILLLWLVARGAGLISVDHFIRRFALSRSNSAKGN